MTTPSLRPRRRRAIALTTGALLLGGAVMALADPGAPTLTSGPGVGATSRYTKNTTPSFGWTTGTGGLETYSWAVDGAPALPAAAGTSATIPAQLDGAHTFSVAEAGDTGIGEASLGPADSVSFTVDTIPPVAASTPVPAPNVNGWYGASVPSVTVTHTCVTSGTQPDVAPIVSGWSPAPFDTITAQTGASGVSTNAGITCADTAGNSTPASSFTVRIDRTAPVFSLAASGGGLGNNNWYTSGTITGNYSCTDPLSGVAVCPADVPVSTDGVFSIPGGTVTDRAGNVSNTVTALQIKRDIRDPSTPVLSTLGPVTNQVRPVFEWGSVDDQQPVGVNQVSGVAGYRLRVGTGASGGSTVYQTAASDLIAQGAGQITFAGLPADLSNGSTYNWTVTAIDNAGNAVTSLTSSFSVDVTAPNPPNITGGPVDGASTRNTTPTFTFGGLPGATFKWQLKNAQGNVIVPAAASFSSTATFTTPVLTDGTYTFEVQQKATNGAVSGYETALFTVDTVAPPPPTITSSPGTTGTPQPGFGWNAGEQGGTFVWEVTGVGGVRVEGPGETDNLTLQLPSALTAGSFVFRVRHKDRAGNQSDWSSPEPFTIVAAPNTPPGTGTNNPTTPVSRFRPSTRNAKALTPKVGAVLKTTAATLRWKRARGATLYNIQVFRIDGTSYRKIHSAFPRGRKYKVPSRILKPGKRYVWRVWPYLGGKRTYSRNPLGISWFDTASPVRK